MEEKPLVSVVIGTYNGRHLLKDSLDSVFSQTYAPYEVILVDDGSTDGTAEFVRERYPSVRLIINGKNLGCTIAYNRGIEAASGEYIATLNNDVKAEPGWMAALMEVAQKDGSIGSCASKLLNFYQPGLIDSAGISFHRGMYAIGRGRGGPDSGQYENEIEIFCACDAAAIFRKEALVRAGLFDTDFFAYQDEFDLGWRIRLAGWKSVYVPRAVAYHIGGATAGAGSKFVRYYMERNRILTIIKNLPLPLLPRYLPFMLKYELDIFLRVIGSFQWELITARFASLKFLNRMLNKRKAIQKGKVISNAELAGWIQKT